MDETFRYRVHAALDGQPPSPDLADRVLRSVHFPPRSPSRRAQALLAALILAFAVGLGASLQAAWRTLNTASSPMPIPNATAPVWDPCLGYTCDGPGAQLNMAYPYRLHTHCGVLGTRFDGRPFYVEAVDPFTVTSGLNNPVDVGTMTLLSPHVAVFRASGGKQIEFVDAPPGVIGQPYPFQVLVVSGGSQLIDRGFAGRLWRAQGSLPGVVGPPYGNGQDRFTVVDGTMTLTGPDTAVFRSSSGAQVRFTLVGHVLCD